VVTEPVGTAAPRGERSAGFTLIEVVIAVLIFGLVMGVLQEYVGTSLRRLSSARDEVVANELGKATLRDVATKIEAGEAVASETGRYENPDYMRYELTVEPYVLALPETVKKVSGEPPLSSIFEPSRSPEDGTPLRRVVVRVYREELGPESAVPLVAVLSIPRETPAAGGAPDGQQQGGENDGNAEGDGNGSQTQRGPGGNRGGRNSNRGGAQQNRGGGRR
jgi:prepilin-type N-terminal cleavage/methylation domain-containing protein